MSRINNLTVMGSGVLGGQIAWHSAFKGKTVVVLDINDESLAKCKVAHDVYAGIYLAEVGATEDQIAQTRARLSYMTDTAAAVANSTAVPKTPRLNHRDG